MYVEHIPNRNSPPAILLRESYREGDKFKRRTLANLSDWPAAKIEALRRVLRDEAVVPTDQQALRLVRSLPHGHVAAALGMLRKLGLDRILSQGGRQPRREVALCIAMIVARLIDPASKLATARGLDAETATCSLGQVLKLGAVDEQELYEALDWLRGEQGRIEQALARRHLRNGMLVLYDVTSTYFEGRTCPLAKLGYSRDGKRHKLQIVFGLLCTAEGQLSLFDERDLAEISSPDYPGERLVACRNPLLADERARKRRALLDATEQDLLEVQARVQRPKRQLRGKDKIALAVGAVVNHYKMAKHFTVVIADDDLTFERKIEQIEAMPPRPSLAKLGYSRDGKRHKLQIVFGLLCTAEGCPVAVEVFEGNVGDPSTLASQISKLKQRFGIERVDRGMITTARLEQTITEETVARQG